MLIWEPPAPFHEDTLCPDYLIVVRCRSLPLQKGKNQVGTEGCGVLCKLLDTQKWKKRVGGGAKGAGSRHTSQEVTLAMLDYKQCALSTSAVLAVEHTTAATATGVARVQGGRGSSLPLSFILHPFSKRRREWVGRVGSRARKALHWWKVTTWKWMRSGLRREGEWENGGNWRALPADMNRGDREEKGGRRWRMKDEE